MLTPLPNRGFLSVSGDDRVKFLQGLVTNDVTRLEENRAVYACLLTPQGKYLHDFFLIDFEDRILIECESHRKEELTKRLNMFRLRSKIEIRDESDVHDSLVDFSSDIAVPDDTEITFHDPRDERLGRRVIAPRQTRDAGDFAGYDRLRISLAVPDGSRDMVPEKSILLENNIDTLNGISWDKGCYMGQELTARTKYRGLIKKRLKPVRIEGAALAPGTPLSMDGREIGEMRTSNGDLGVALLKLDLGASVFPMGETTLSLL